MGRAWERWGKHGWAGPGGGGSGWHRPGGAPIWRRTPRSLLARVRGKRGFFFRRADLRAVGGRGPSEVRAARGASEITEGRDGRGSQSGERACWAAARRGRGSRRA